MVIYLNGEYVERDRARLPLDDRGFLFADGVYEVIRFYDGRMFEADAHLERLAGGLRAIRIDYPNARGLIEVARQLLERNDVPRTGSRFYVQITRGAARRAHAFPPPGTPPTVYADVAPLATHPEEQERGAAAVTTADQRWARCDIKSIALLPNVLASQHAAENGVREAIFLKDGMVTEASHSSVFAVVDGVVRTAPLSNLILAGVTRRVVLELCDELALPVGLFPLTESDLRQADEVFITGTSCEVTPIVRIDGRSVANGVPGPVTRRLRDAFARRVGAIRN